jgi:hypothetical protein
MPAARVPSWIVASVADIQDSLAGRAGDVLRFSGVRRVSADAVSATV